MDLGRHTFPGSRRPPIVCITSSVRAAIHWQAARISLAIHSESSLEALQIILIFLMVYNYTLCPSQRRLFWVRMCWVALPFWLLPQLAVVVVWLRWLTAEHERWWDQFPMATFWREQNTKMPVCCAISVHIKELEWSKLMCIPQLSCVSACVQLRDVKLHLPEQTQRCLAVISAEQNSSTTLLSDQFIWLAQQLYFLHHPGNCCTLKATFHLLRPVFIIAAKLGTY